MVIEMPLKGGIMSALLILLMAYYVFDLRYMPRHAMALTVLQNFVIGEPSTISLSQQCVFFMKKVRTAIVELPAEPDVQTE